MKTGKLFIFFFFICILLSACGGESAAPLEGLMEEEVSGTEVQSQSRDAVLTPAERELTIESGQFLYGALRVGLPEGVSVQRADSPLKGLAVDFYGLEAYEEYPNNLEPRIWLSSYQAEYQNKEALITALLEKTGGSGIFWHCREEKREFYGQITGELTTWYLFIKDTEVYLIECLYWEENYAFPWLLEKEKQVGWADTGEQILYSEEYDSPVYTLFSHEAGEWLMTYTYYAHARETALYKKGFYDTPFQQLLLDVIPSQNLQKDWNFDGYTDLVFGEKIYLWSREKQSFVPTRVSSFSTNQDTHTLEISSLNSHHLEDAVLWEETKTIWTVAFFRGELQGAYGVWNTEESLWQWEKNKLIKIRECREWEEEGKLYLYAYDYAAGQALFNEVLSLESVDCQSQVKQLYQSFYGNLVSDTFYALEHKEEDEEKQIPEALESLLAAAIEEGTESETLSAMVKDRELSREEVFAFAREYPNVRATLAQRSSSSPFCLLEADLDNDGRKDILAQIHSGGSGGFVDFIFYQGQEDGSYEETDSFGSVEQEFAIIYFEGKNYLCRTEFDYMKKLYSGLSVSCFEEGICQEELSLTMELDSYHMQVEECLSSVYEPVAEEMLKEGPSYKARIEDYETLLGSAEEELPDEDMNFSCDIDNDGEKERYKKYIWTTTTIRTRDGLGFEWETEDEGLSLLLDTLWAEEESGWPIMFWADTHGEENIVHAVYITGLYDFEVAGYLLKEGGITQLYRVRGEADWYVDCVRNENFVQNEK